MKKLALALVVLCGVWMLWPSTSSESNEHDAEINRPAQMFFDRIWITEIPEDPKQKIHYLIAAHNGGHFGVFGHTSAYEGQFSVWEYKFDHDSKTLKVKMLQTDKKKNLKFSVSKGGCEPFDYCLKVRGAPGKRYGSMEDWVIEGGQELPAAVRAKVFAETE